MDLQWKKTKRMMMKLNLAVIPLLCKGIKTKGTTSISSSKLPSLNISPLEAFLANAFYILVVRMLSIEEKYISIVSNL